MQWDEREPGPCSLRNNVLSWCVLNLFDIITIKLPMCE